MRDDSELLMERAWVSNIASAVFVYRAENCRNCSWPAPTRKKSECRYIDTSLFRFAQGSRLHSAGICLQDILLGTFGMSKKIYK